jgi:hypothetical protein
MADAFPAVGHKYIVTFTADDGAGQLRVQLDFHSLTSEPDLYSTIITNITSPGDGPNNPDFSKFHGVMKQVA